MADITAGMIKQLRETTGARLLDCQQALKETNGDHKAAIDFLRKKNQSTGEAIQAKTASEGLLGHRYDGTRLVIVEMTANTDFVAKNDEFKTLLDKLVNFVFEWQYEPVENMNVERLLPMMMDGRSVSETVNELAGKIGESISIKNVFVIQKELYGFYVHHDSKQAAVVVLNNQDAIPILCFQFGRFDILNVRTMCKQIAMHIVAAKPVPICISRDQVPSDLVAHEQSVIEEKLKTDPKNAKKPPEILAKISAGQMGKFYSEKCLLEQPFLGENARTVEKFLGDLKVGRFEYFKVGS